MKTYHINEKKPEKAVLIGAVIRSNPAESTIDELEELKLLAKTTGVNIIKLFMQKILKPNPSTFIGKGKLEEIANYINNEEIDIAIFDNVLSPSQLKNIEKIFKIKILDRTHLILDIFATRAKTAHSKVQVELAQYQYLLPRLTRMWTHLERQQGGVGVRGPGEKEIETDRRNIRKRITRLKSELKKIEKQKMTQRKSRGNLIRVALVGYTNTGKSTIMNVLSRSNVFEQNQVFATLDTTVRRVKIKDKLLLLSDTVGFIRKLPHTLIESFKATLDEVREADILLHIVDFSNKDYEKQIAVVNDTLKEIGAGDKRIVIVYNKIDLTDNVVEMDNSDALLVDNTKNKIFISAKKGKNIERFKNMIYKIIEEYSNQNKFKLIEKNFHIKN